MHLIFLTGVLPFSLLAYVGVWLNRRRHEQFLLDAVGRISELLAAPPSSPRRLLGEIAGVLDAQDQLAERMDGLQDGDDARDLIAEILALPEPQLIVEDFLAEHAGTGNGPSRFHSSVVRAALSRVLTDPPVELRDLARRGHIAPIAHAILATPSSPATSAVPRIDTLDRRRVGRIAEKLDEATRRQMRLVVLLHDQAERVLRSGSPARALYHRMFGFRRPPVDLPGLATALEAAGETLVLVDERLAAGEPGRAAGLLASLRLPVPAGFPGRRFHQALLEQVRPLAEYGVAHRLAVVAWAARWAG